VDDLVAKINGTSEDAGAMFNGTDVRVSDFVTAQRLGSGATSTIRIEGKPLPAKPILNDMRANQYQVDRLDFNVYVTTGADTTMDPRDMYDRCGQGATITVVQDANYTKGSSAEIALMEQRTYSYQPSVMRDLLWNKDWNGAFTSYV